MTDAPTEPETDTPTEEPTAAPTESVTEASTADTTTETDDPAKKGCGSVIGMSAVAVMSAAATFVALKKKD